VIWGVIFANGSVSPYGWYWRPSQMLITWTQLINRSGMRHSLGSESQF
jgi:hypothetical protein